MKRFIKSWLITNANTDYLCKHFLKKVYRQSKRKNRTCLIFVKKTSTQLFMKISIFVLLVILCFQPPHHPQISNHVRNRRFQNIITASGVSSKIYRDLEIFKFEMSSKNFSTSSFERTLLLRMVKTISITFSRKSYVTKDLIFQDEKRNCLKTITKASNSSAT